MCANGRAMMQVSMRVAIARNGLTGFPDNCSLARCNSFSRFGVSFRKPIAVLSRNIQVLTRPVSQRSHLRGERRNVRTVAQLQRASAVGGSIKSKKDSTWWVLEEYISTRFMARFSHRSEKHT